MANLLGLIFVLASVSSGVWDPFFTKFVAPLLGLPAERLASPVVEVAGVKVNLCQTGSSRRSRRARPSSTTPGSG